MAIDDPARTMRHWFYDAGYQGSDRWQMLAGDVYAPVHRGRRGSGSCSSALCYVTVGGTFQQAGKPGLSYAGCALAPVFIAHISHFSRISSSMLRLWMIFSSATSVMLLT